MGQITITNHLGFNSIADLLAALLGIFVTVATPIVVLMIVYSGFLFTTARGNELQLQKAKQSFTLTIIGAVLILGSFAIAQIIKNVVDSFVP